MENKAEFFRKMLAVGREQQLYSEGRLMSPAQVAAGLSAQTQSNQILEGWFLCGELHPVLFSLVKAGLQAQPLILVKPGALGVEYFLYAQRFGRWQHRFLMSLVGDSAKRFLSETQYTGIGISFSTVSAADAVVSRLAPRERWKPLFDRQVPSRLERQKVNAFTDELTHVALHLLTPGALNTESVGIERACVTVALTGKILGNVHDGFPSCFSFSTIEAVTSGAPIPSSGSVRT